VYIPIYLKRPLSPSEPTPALVLTSFTMGGHPNVLESIACGTTLLAIPKGAIPDIFIDCETWFIMEDNLPEFISGR
jgi:glycosyltransferase involved in cell wall biosynthesis